MKSGGIRDDRLSDLLDRCGDCVLLRRDSDGEGNEMIKDCCSCIHEYRSPMSDICRECGIAMLNYEERKPQTNANRIRAMTDEELAELIGDNIDCSVCKKEVFQTTTCPGSLTADGPSCYECWLSWLKAPVEEVDK